MLDFLSINNDKKQEVFGPPHITMKPTKHKKNIMEKKIENWE